MTSSAVKKRRRWQMRTLRNVRSWIASRKKNSLFPWKRKCTKQHVFLDFERAAELRDIVLELKSSMK